MSHHDKPYRSEEISPVVEIAVPHHGVGLPLGKLVTLVQLALLHLPRPHQLLLLLQELTV